MRKNPRESIHKEVGTVSRTVDVKNIAVTKVNTVLKKSIQLRSRLEEKAYQARIAQLAKTGQLEWTKNGKKIRINLPHATVRTVFNAAIKHNLFDLQLSNSDPVITFSLGKSALGLSRLRLSSQFTPLTVNFKYFHSDLSGALEIISFHNGRKLRTLVSFTGNIFASSTTYFDSGRVASVSPVLDEIKPTSTRQLKKNDSMHQAVLPEGTLLSGGLENQPKRKTYSNIEKKPWHEVTLYNENEALAQFKSLVIQCARSLPAYARGKYIDSSLSSAKIQKFTIKGKTCYRVEMVLFGGSRCIMTRFLIADIWKYCYPPKSKKFTEVTHINQYAIMQKIFQRYYDFVHQVGLREKNKATIERITTDKDHVFCGIGINNYRNVKQLHGCANDVQSIGDSLQSKRRHIATGTVSRAQMVKTLTAAVQDSLRFNKECVICYSGHGGRRSTGIFDFVPSDYDKKNPRIHLTGAQFFQIIKPLLSRGIRVKVILDCCHAATFGKNTSHPLLTSLCASQADQKSLEFGTSGSFSYGLAKGLKKYGPRKLGKAFLHSENVTAWRSYRLGKGFYQETEIYQKTQLAQGKRKRSSTRYT